jgi:quercetin dioxygenase-like cupin family protein
LDNLAHPTPQAQFCIVLAGLIEVTTGNGEAKRFESGSVLVMSDTSGEGHRTQNVGDSEGLVMMVHLE